MKLPIKHLQDFLEVSSESLLECLGFPYIGLLVNFYVNYVRVPNQGIDEFIAAVFCDALFELGSPWPNVALSQHGQRCPNMGTCARNGPTSAETGPRKRQKHDRNMQPSEVLISVAFLW